MFNAVIFFTIIIFLWIYFEIKKPKNFPSGPRWYPIFGSAIQISKLRLKHGMFCKAITELNEYYDGNGVIGLKIGKDKLVLACTSDTIKEMLTNEDLDGRPKGPFYEVRTFGTKKGILLTDGSLWHEHRRFVMRHLKEFGFARRGMIDLIQNEAVELTKDISNEIDKQNGENGLIQIQELFGVYVLNTLWSMLAGKRYDRNNEELVKLQQLIDELFKNITMAGCLFSHFPFLRFIAPHYSGYTQYLDTHERVYKFLRNEVDNHKKVFKLENEPQDLMDSYLQVISGTTYRSTFSEEQLLAVCLDLFLAGSETTAKTLGFAFLYMIRDNSIQTKAQIELDEVIGRERAPTYDDRVNLPYCDAIVHEALRFFMGNSFGVAHRALKNTRLCGYNIPKDTMVIPCFHGTLMNEKNFEDPERFYPERFLINNKLVIPDCFVPFGVGRHRCMGEMMGRQNLFILITTLLQNYRFLIPDGDPEPDPTPLDGATPTVKPFLTLVTRR